MSLKMIVKNLGVLCSTNDNINGWGQTRSECRKQYRYI